MNIEQGMSDTADATGGVMHWDRPHEIFLDQLAYLSQLHDRLV